ncbi:vWA domain-containing protein [Paenibacillus hexagrammi]|uniref:VWFA domain-containing protein n=1 Tax=Paenibacillus hexagrammi TaxID=2908839 RepID=A0ABY3SNH9_9BACL|nr:hypothetical protein [Paenibacillus sp. YPD9-1]UJF35105.1 hypothetical protein L0M14_08210 [Paenibacillus sp. YPD9-1]
MGINWERPWLLLLLVLLLLYTWLVWKRAPRLYGVRKYIVFTLRFFLLLLLICCLAGTQVFTWQHNRSVVFAVDRSDSVKAQSTLASWIQSAAQTKAAEDVTGVVSIGLDAALETAVSNRSLEDFNFTTKMNTQFSNIAEGLQLGAGMLHTEGGKRIVLLSDGGGECRRYAAAGQPPEGSRSTCGCRSDPAAGAQGCGSGVASNTR